MTKCWLICLSYIHLNENTYKLYKRNVGKNVLFKYNIDNVYDAIYLDISTCCIGDKVIFMLAYFPH